MWAWAVLALLLVVELLAVVGLGVGGWGLGPTPLLRWLLAALLPLVGVLAWWAFAAPRARWGGPVRRPVTKVLVLGGACAVLALAGHRAWALALLALVLGVHALAALPAVRTLREQDGHGGRAVGP